MKLLASSLITLFVAGTTVAGTTPAACAKPPSELCSVLRAFVRSVQPDERREFAFRTSWGANFNDANEPVLFAKRCEHGDYPPARKVCTYLMEHGPTEFADSTVKDAISCLSHTTGFDERLHISSGEFSFSYGKNDRGSLIDITFGKDPVAGGMVFRLVANGY